MFKQWYTCQERTELLGIGCLTGFIWISRFILGTSTPNIDSQTYWPQVISHVTNGTTFFICSTSAISALSAALRNSAWLAAPKRWRRGCKNKKKKTGLWQNPSLWAMNLTSTVPASSSCAKNLVTSSDPGILKASTGKPDARARRNSKSVAASSS